MTTADLPAPVRAVRNSLTERYLGSPAGTRVVWPEAPDRTRLDLVHEALEDRFLTRPVFLEAAEVTHLEKDLNGTMDLLFSLPDRLFGSRNASVFVTGTDLYLLTNYSGLDPIVNGNTAAVGGSGAAGIDYGNFPIPRGLNVGVKLGF